MIDRGGPSAVQAPVREERALAEPAETDETTRRPDRARAGLDATWVEIPANAKPARQKAFRGARRDSGTGR